MHTAVITAMLLMVVLIIMIIITIITVVAVARKTIWVQARARWWHPLKSVVLCGHCYTRLRATHLRPVPLVTIILECLLLQAISNNIIYRVEVVMAHLVSVEGR